jgi:uncharacterized protein YciI
MHFLIRAHDGAGLLERRLEVRESHLVNVEESKSSGVLLYAAALLDDQDRPKGSVLIVNFPNREELDAWLRTEPYVVHQVWETIDVEPIRAAPSFS